MIFVTVGMQLGFDRLIQAMDRLAPELGEEVIAQTGNGTYVPKNCAFQSRYSPLEMEELFRQARLIIAHAGIGTLLAAQRHSKTVVLLPRRADLGEHRNDHQLATARRLQNRPGVTVAFEVDDLRAAIESVNKSVLALDKANPELVKLKQAIAMFIENGNLAP